MAPRFPSAVSLRGKQTSLSAVPLTNWITHLTNKRHRQLWEVLILHSFSFLLRWHGLTRLSFSDQLDKICRNWVACVDSKDSSMWVTLQVTHILESIDVICLAEARTSQFNFALAAPCRETKNYLFLLFCAPSKTYCSTQQRFSFLAMLDRKIPRQLIRPKPRHQRL